MPKTAADVELLVALLTEVDGQDPPRRECMALDDPIHDRMTVVLDAVANVLVSKPKGEVIAVGFQQRQEPDREIILTVASNSNLPDCTLQHARFLLDKLHKLGREFADFRLKTTAPDNQSDDWVSSPWIDEHQLPDDLLEKSNLFRKDAFLFSLPKLRQRLNKPWARMSLASAFIGYVDAVDSISHSKDLDNRELIGHLRLIRDVLDFALPVVNQNNNHDPEDMAKLVDGMGQVDDALQEIQKIKAWEAKLFAIAETEFPLERFLKKAVSLSRAVDTLLKYAKSPRLYRRYLDRTKIHVQQLSNAPRPISLLTTGDWNDVCKEALLHHAATSLLELITEDCNRPGAVIRSRFENQDTIQAPVHSCALFLKSLSRTGHQFCTKGSHAKAYFPWKYPDIEIAGSRISEGHRAEILESFYESLSEIYVSRLQAREKLRKLSNSSAEIASGGSRKYKFSFRKTAA
ncbi:hypothetical protein ACO22_02603 [Paracoccidioides brasiliensis]|uniref:Uncharacterized protein n=1 Tax=Paracoccidioides brasiliensis TaxID=121759 RepID=A0A1D2JI99_PARBR|nr:hypothetical protein ACO22_02603 [Paracoccidioides brasiliensis]